MIYKGSVKLQDQSEIPLFTNGHPMHSKYNPMAAANAFADSLKPGFIVTGGIGGGFHIKSALKKFPASFFICVEADDESLEFSRSLNKNNELENNSNVIFTTVQNIKKTLLDFYTPAEFDGFSFANFSSWEAENIEVAKKLSEDIKEALYEIKADYSVQAWFGKQWHHNILVNAETAKNQKPLLVDTKKSCLIVAAGPSLDMLIPKIKQEQKDVFILSCDTAFQSLLSHGIIADAVISCDCQHISCEHFFTVHPAQIKKTVFIFDLSSPVSAVNHVKKMGHDVFFVQSGHPLSAALFSKKDVPYISAGSGTVAIAACSFARTLGFKTLWLSGCDFSYSNGKSYASGTYLEKNYSAQSTFFNPCENRFCSLMFRTELLKCEKPHYAKIGQNAKTSEVLNRYKNSMSEFFLQNGFVQKNSSDSSKYIFETSLKYQNPIESNPVDYKKKRAEVTLQNKPSKENLPLIAFLRRVHPDKTYDELCHLAYQFSAEYN